MGYITREEVEDQVLQKVIKYLLENDCVDACSMCAYYRELSSKELADLGDENPCKYNHEQGEIGCQRGLIEFFKKLQ